MNTCKRYILFLTFIGLLFTDFREAYADNKNRKITPAHVFAHAGLLQGEIEILRQYLGKPKNNQLDLPIEHAHPREVYFQAVTLLKKMDKFCFEQILRRGSIPAHPVGETQPKDVYGLIDASLSFVKRIKLKLHIQDKAIKEKIDKGKTPTDVFNRVIQMNRQLNLMLVYRFSSSDVFQKVSDASNLANVMLHKFSKNKKLKISEPKYVNKKSSPNVYAELLSCITILEAISKNLDVEMLKLKRDEVKIGHQTPSDVFDMASIVVSELSNMRRKYLTTDNPNVTDFPGKKIPSDVYQKVGLLKK